MSQRSSAFTVIKVGIVLLVLVGGSYAYWLSSRPVVTVETVKRGKAVQAVTGSVTVRAELPRTVKSAVGGRVAKASLEVGASVKEDEFLVQIDTADLELDIESTEDALRVARKKVEVGSSTPIELENAKVDLENATRSHAMGLNSSLDLDRVRRTVRGIEQRVAIEKVNSDANIQALENALKAKRRLKDKMTVRSPLDGVITDVYVSPNDLIGGEQVVATLISNSRIIEAMISEENFAGVQVGQRAQVRFLGYGDERFEATVSKVLPTADPATQRYRIHLDVKIDRDRLKPGLTGEVAVLVGERQNALLFPRLALFNGSVYVASKNVVELRKVSVGFVSLNDVECLEGLQEGEQVLVDSLDLVTPGSRVKVKTAR
jgi:RND family efflux transporter MFP subunit